MLIVDTNIFHECRRLEDLPWENLGEPDEIVLIVTEPVQSELDTQKSSAKTRIKRRALEWTKHFRELITNDQTDHVIRPSEPRVIVRLDATQPDAQHDDVLDRFVADDAIVAIALTIQSEHTAHTVAIFTDDLRPMQKAKKVGFAVKNIPDDWRREPEQTEEDKEIARLKQEVVKLQKQEPELILATSTKTPIKKILPIYKPLSESESDQLIEAIRNRYPIETDFERARKNTSPGRIRELSSAIPQSRFIPAPQKDISRYIEEHYPNWIKKCRELLDTAHNCIGLTYYGLRLSIELSNKGTRPAHDLQLRFKTNGNIGIMPGDDEETAQFLKTQGRTFLPPECTVCAPRWLAKT
ncbi:MAG: PIN domain-containing protein [Aestuariivita sp.]|nr:PIN domain-containing protein [Aestuariivita sp.]